MAESIEQFAQRIKDRYPQYADVDQYELVSRVSSKFPTYNEDIELPGFIERLKLSFGDEQAQK